MINRNPLLAPTLFTSLSTMINHAIETFEEATLPRNTDHQLYATDSGWVLRLDATGLEKQDITLKYEDEALHISAEKSEFDLNKRFTLGQDVDVENIEAKIENGVLELTLPKTNSTKNINIL